MTATRNDLIADTLRNLRKLGAEAPPADDAERVGDALDQLYERLRVEGLTSNGAGVWTLADTPLEFVRSLVIIASSDQADTFHVPDGRIVRLRLEAVKAENDIRRIAGILNDGAPVKAEQF